jgi:serine O-acetyltransferase
MPANQEAFRKIHSRRDYLEFLREDMRAYGIDSWKFEFRYRFPTLYYQRLMRRVEYLQTKRGVLYRIRRFWARYRLQKIGLLTSLTIPPGTCGPGLSIAHYGSVVINTKARIGAYCRLHPGVTIGTGNGGVPKIGNGVYIAPGAVLYGSITVGDESIVGANSVLNVDVPSGFLAAGNPARILKERNAKTLMPEHIKCLLERNYHRGSL